MTDWDAIAYSSNDSCPHLDAKYCLRNYGYVLEWRQFNSILDIGCADGFVTSQILSKYFKHCKEIVGVDFNENLIQFANENYATDSLTFEVLDIRTEQLPIEFEDRFDHICSFYCFNWLKNDQRYLQVIRYDLLIF